MKYKNKTDKFNRIDLTRRQLFGAAGAAVASVALAGTGGFVGGRTSLDERIRNLEGYRRDAEAINALYSFANPHYTEEFNPDEAFRHLTQSIALVKAGKNGSGQEIMSTGVLIGDYVLCTHHGIEAIVKPGKEIADTEKGEVIIHDNNLYGFRFVDVDKDNDLALLHVSSDGYFSPVKVTGTSDKLKVGREIRVLGTRPDRTIYNQIGKITFVGDLEDKAKGKYHRNKFVTDAYAKEGFSGGILADPNGSFLGMIQYKKEPEEHAVGVGWNIISPFLMKVAAKESERILQYKRV